MRRGTHVRADATGPCRGCATAVSCRAASCMSRRPCPRPVCCAHCTSVAQTCRAALRVTRQLLPRSPTDVPAPWSRQRCRMHPEHLLQAASGSHSGLQSQSDRTIAVATHAHATGGGFPDARLLLPARRVHLVCIAQGICSWHARMLTQIGRQRPLGARVACELGWTRGLPSECERVGCLYLHIRQARTVARAAPG
jgi:hypothetical protein